MASALAARTFWRQLLERAARQATQTIVPIIAAAQTSGPLAWHTIATAAAIATSVTILKGIAGITAQPDSAWGWRLLDRAAPAAAGTILGFIPVDASGITVDWTRVATAAASAATVAALAYYITPPTLPRPPGRHALDHTYDRPPRAQRRPIAELELPATSQNT